MSENLVKPVLIAYNKIVNEKEECYTVENAANVLLPKIDEVLIF